MVDFQPIVTQGGIVEQVERGPKKEHVCSGEIKQTVRVLRSGRRIVEIVCNTRDGCYELRD